MSEETAPTLESLALAKPLEKMTAKELREMCKEKLPMIVGVTGMDKPTLVSAVKQVLGIAEEPKPVPNEHKVKVGAIKGQMKTLKAAKATTEGNKAREQLRRKLGKLKKRSRRSADQAKATTK